MDKKKKISLNDLDKKLPFTIPEGYFEDFSARMGAKVPQSKSTVKHMTSSWIYIAATFIGVFILGYLFYSLYQSNLNEKDLFYDTYLLSQIDNVSLIDFYLDEFEEELP